MKTKDKTYRDLDYNDVQDFAWALGLNAEGEENHREASQLLFEVMEFAEPNEKSLRLDFDNSSTEEDEGSNLYAWIYRNHFIVNKREIDELKSKIKKKLEKSGATFEKVEKGKGILILVRTDISIENKEVEIVTFPNGDQDILIDGIKWTPDILLYRSEGDEDIETKPSKLGLTPLLTSTTITEIE